MANKQKLPPIITPEFRLAFPSVFEPNAFAGGGEEKYSITMLFPKGSDIASLKNLAAQACAMEWGADKTKWPTPLHNPFGDGDTKEWDGFAGNVFVRATSYYPPGVVDSRNQPIIDPKKVYGGCYAKAQVNAFAWTYMGKSGVSFGVSAMQVTRDGEPFGNRDATKIFAPIPGAEGSAPPVDGGDIFG